MLTTFHSQFNALGSEVIISFCSSMPDREANALLKLLEREVYLFERRFSRFLPSSELTLFNLSAGVKTRISEEFQKILVEVKRFGKSTDGLYNPFILPALQKSGYLQSAVKGYEKDKQEDFSGRSVAEVEALEVGEGWAHIPYGTAIDLGGIGKGYLADQLAKNFKEYEIGGFWVSLGGDILAGGVDENAETYKIDIQDASDTNRRSDWFVDCKKSSTLGIASSGTLRKLRSMKNGHHIIDPRTGQSAQTDILLATVCSNSATHADITASCLVILGSEKAKAFVGQNTSINSVLLQYKNSKGRIVTWVYGDLIAQKNPKIQNKEARYAA